MAVAAAFAETAAEEAAAEPDAELFTNPDALTAGEQAEAAAAATLVSASCGDNAQLSEWGAHFLFYPLAATGPSPLIPPAAVQMMSRSEEPKTWWSKLEGSLGQRWRVRRDCRHFMNVTEGPMLDAPILHRLSKGDRCIQAAPMNVLVVHSWPGDTEVLKMAIKPKGWITVAMRGQENHGFLEMDSELEREDRTKEQHGLKKPGKALSFEGPIDEAQLYPWTWHAAALGERLNGCSARGHALLELVISSCWEKDCMCCGGRLRAHNTYQCCRCNMMCCMSCKLEAESRLPRNPKGSRSLPGLLVPLSCSRAPGSGSACYVLGHNPVSGKLGWSAIDGDCYFCDKPLTIEGTGCLSCQVKCCRDCTLRDPHSLNGRKRGMCDSCCQPVIPGTKHTHHGNLLCNMCQPSYGAASARRVDEAIAKDDTVARDDLVALQKRTFCAAATLQQAVQAFPRDVARDDVGYMAEAAASEAKAVQQAAVACDVDDLVEAAAAAAEVDMEDSQAANFAAKRKADFEPCGDLMPAQAARDVARADVADHMEYASAKHSSRRRRILLAGPPASGLQPGTCAATSGRGVPVLFISRAAGPAVSPSSLATQHVPSTPRHSMGTTSSSVPCPTCSCPVIRRCLC